MYVSTLLRLLCYCEGRVVVLGGIQYVLPRAPHQPAQRHSD